MDRGSWHCVGGSDQNYPQEKEMQKGKIVVWEGLTNTWEKKRNKRQRRKGKLYPSECRVPKNSKERKESLPKRTVQRNRGNNRTQKTRDLFKKIRDTKGTLHAKMGTIKDRNKTEAEEIKQRWQEYTKELYRKKIFMTQITTMVWSLT